MPAEARRVRLAYYWLSTLSQRATLSPAPSCSLGPCRRLRVKRVQALPETCGSEAELWAKSFIARFSKTLVGGSNYERGSPRLNHHSPELYPDARDKRCSVRPQPAMDNLLGPDRRGCERQPVVRWCRCTLTILEIVRAVPVSSIRIASRAFSASRLRIASRTCSCMTRES